ncbi:MAG TPA: hypothetical protein VF359_05845 [Anaerolineales bacterium]
MRRLTVGVSFLLSKCADTGSPLGAGAECDVRVDLAAREHLVCRVESHELVAQRSLGIARPPSLPWAHRRSRPRCPIHNLIAFSGN